MPEIQYMPLICRIIVFIMLVFFPTRAPEPVILKELPSPTIRRHHYATHEMFYIQAPLIAVNVSIFVVTILHAAIHFAGNVHYTLKNLLDLVTEHQFYCYVTMITLSFAVYTKNINDTTFFFTMSAYHALNTICGFFESKSEKVHGNQSKNHHPRPHGPTHTKNSILEHCLHTATLFIIFQVIQYCVPNDTNYMHHIVGFTLPEITAITLRSVFHGSKAVFRLLTDMLVVDGHH